MSWKDKKWVFVDIETTGGRQTKNRIIEIALIVVHPSGKEERWQSLIHPDCVIPNHITAITHITNNMVLDAPKFNEIAQKLYSYIEGAIFVAHNVGFDYHFIRSEFQRIGLPYKSRKFCTVQLSRKLFPEARSHSLDSIINNFNFRCKERHRAMDDIEATKSFFDLCKNRFEKDSFEAAIDFQLKMPSLPPNLDYDQIDDLPDSHGVYEFYDKNAILTYIGKSKNIRKRVLSHFSNLKSDRSKAMIGSLNRIEYRSTMGEMHSLLTEATWVKLKSPLYNKKLKGNQLFKTFHLKGYDQIPQLEILDLKNVCKKSIPDCYGLFRSIQTAKKFLANMVSENKLCDQLTGIENSVKGPCFSYQIKKCSGACVHEITPQKHFFQLLKILNPKKLAKWPIDGSLGFEEICPITGSKAIHIFRKWIYLGSGESDDEIHEILTVSDTPFDYDFFKIALKFLENPGAIKIRKF